MFQLSLVDHIRVSFGSVVGAYEGHAEAGARLARRAWHAKLATLVTIGLGAGASLGGALHGGWFIVAAPYFGAAAFVVCAVHLAIDPETRAYAHRSTAARLWLMCEQYRALLAEIHDKLIDIPAVVERRDVLLKAQAQIFEQAPPADRATYDIARTALGGAHSGGYSDQQVDQFLPPSLRRAHGASA